MSVICFLMSISSMSHVEFTKRLCRSSILRVKSPKKQGAGGGSERGVLFRLCWVSVPILESQQPGHPEAGLLRNDRQIMQFLSVLVTEK